MTQYKPSFVMRLYLIPVTPALTCKGNENTWGFFQSIDIMCNKTSVKYIYKELKFPSH